MSKMAKVKSCRGCPGFQDCGTAYINGDGFYKTHPDCPLPDYVDVERLQKERDELVKALKFIAYPNIYGDNVLISQLKSIAREALSKIKGEINDA